MIKAPTINGFKQWDFNTKPKIVNFNLGCSYLVMGLKPIVSSNRKATAKPKVN